MLSLLRIEFVASMMFQGRLLQLQASLSWCHVLFLLLFSHYGSENAALLFEINYNFWKNLSVASLHLSERSILAVPSITRFRNCKYFSLQVTPLPVFCLLEAPTIFSILL